MVLPDTGVLGYGDVIFTSLVSSRISARPVYDDAQRVVSYIEYTLTVNGYVSFGQYDTPDPDPYEFPTTDKDMAKLRKTLLTPGLTLVFSKKGFGNLFINTQDGTVRDLVWGPRPRLLEWVPIGYAAAKVNWQVQFALPRCSEEGIEHRFVPMEYNYAWSVSIDQRGLTTRTVSGYWKIPQTWAAPNFSLLTDTADMYRDQAITFPVPEKFVRVRQEYNLSADKCRMDFNIVDQEIPGVNMYPEGIADISINCRISGRADGSSGGVIKTYHWSLNGHITVAQGYPTSLAYDKFYEIFAERYGHMVKKIQQHNSQSSSPSSSSKVKIVALPTEFSVDEEIFGNTTRVSVSFLIIVPPDEGSLINTKVLEISGIYVPLTFTWQKWKQSMSETAHHVRGHAKLAVLPENDTLYDICLRNYGMEGEVDFARQIASADDSEQELDNLCGAYLYWKNDLEVVNDRGRVFHVPLRYQQTIVQQKTRSTQFELIMRGVARRIGMVADIPKLEKVEHQGQQYDVAQYGRPTIRTVQMGWFSGYPIFDTVWVIRYRIKVVAQNNNTVQGTATLQSGDDFDEEFLNPQAINNPPHQVPSQVNDRPDEAQCKGRSFGGGFSGLQSVGEADEGMS